VDLSLPPAFLLIMHGIIWKKKLHYFQSCFNIVFEIAIHSIVMMMI